MVTVVLSLVMVQVNQFYCYADSFYYRFFQGVRFSNDGNYQPVVVFIVTIIQ